MGGRPSGAARRRMMVSLATVAAVAALLIAFPLLAGAIEQEWRYYKPVALPDSAVAPSLVELELDPEVYAHAASGARGHPRDGAAGRGATLTSCW